MVSGLSDEYVRRARIYPALVTGLPISVLAVIVGLINAPWWSALVGVVVASGFWALVAQIGRHAGKRKEPNLFALWGGMPTTTLLRHRDNPNPVRLAGLHAQLAQLTGLNFPSAEEEGTDPTHADHIYETATDHLRVPARNKERFRDVFNENCNYGFRRNLWGLRPWGIGACILAAFIGTLLIALDPDFVHVEAGILTALIALDLVGVVVWWQLVTPDWVKQTAFAYADRLLETAMTSRNVGR